MKKFLNLLLLSAVAVIIAGMAFEQALKVYNYVNFSDHTQTWYVEGADATCIQTLDPYAERMFCFRGDSTKESK